MTNTASNPGFSEIWLADFEYNSRPGELPEPVCLAAREYISGREILSWQDDLKLRMVPPYSVDGDSLFVSYFASAELGCHLVLDWEFPVNVLDLYAEFRCLTNGHPTPLGKGLLGAMAYFGLDCMGASEKDVMRDLVIQGGPWTTEERKAILKYCHSDVVALGNLLTVMLPQIDLQRALLRGRSMKAVARMEHCGVPIDIGALEALREHWLPIQDALIVEIDKDYGVFAGRTFKLVRWETFVINNRIPWPQLESGRLDLSDDTFREMARVHPQVAPIRELRVALSQMRLSNLAVGGDGRNRCLLSPFQVRQGGTSPRTADISLDRQPGFEGSSVPGRAWELPTWIGSSRNLASRLPCQETLL